ncbi:TPR repeat-containing protein [Gluconacetobacter johannae DSM 13595]|uniref:tetratricopeptide repeat-containing glycosyltransferase family protein n=1 Tax=Gluconacetobacter johannae TaxID=112140 RepID=UPI002156A80D|nr:tetratricopeptide repeat-containing glycosyltransferase family protein [Gluconacetobacter johannae]GBQ86759.1 TPR repeat-containing protein [Gluconacetobacter johannae DSM 13595]
MTSPQNEDVQDSIVVFPGHDLPHPPTAEKLTEACALFCGEGKIIEAVRLVLTVASSHPDNVALLKAGATVIWTHTGRYDIVATLLQQAVTLEPHDMQAQQFLADALVTQGDLAGGCAVFSRIMDLWPQQRGDTTLQISKTLLAAGYPLEALKILASWLETGELTAGLLNNIAVAFLYLNRSTEALSWAEKAVAAEPKHPGLSFTYAIVLLKAGHHREGWERYALREPATDDMARRFTMLPRLRHGDDVAGRKIILYQEQGLGDTLQFIRFVPFLLARGADVTIAVPSSLARLMAMSFPSASVRSLQDCGTAEGYEYAVPIPDLPFIAGVASESDIPAQIPYLRADVGDIARFAARLPPRRPRIGIVWAGERRAQYENVTTDRRRSVTLAEMGAAFTPIEASLVSLQFGSLRQQITDWHGQPLFDPMGDVHDMADTAAIMENLDLIISVDTSPAHIAGGLGRPVWLISRRDACWRWGDEGEATPWYPTMRLFRSRERTCASVLPEVGAALRHWVEAWHTAHDSGATTRAT